MFLLTSLLPQILLFWISEVLTLSSVSFSEPTKSLNPTSFILPFFPSNPFFYSSKKLSNLNIKNALRFYLHKVTNAKETELSLQTPSLSLKQLVVTSVSVPKTIICVFHVSNSFLFFSFISSPPLSSPFPSLPILSFPYPLSFPLGVPDHLKYFSYFCSSRISFVSCLCLFLSFQFPSRIVSLVSVFFFMIFVPVSIVTVCDLLSTLLFLTLNRFFKPLMFLYSWESFCSKSLLRAIHSQFVFSVMLTDSSLKFHL